MPSNLYHVLLFQCAWMGIRQYSSSNWKCFESYYETRRIRFSQILDSAYIQVVSIQGLLVSQKSNIRRSPVLSLSINTLSTMTPKGFLTESALDHGSVWTLEELIPQVRPCQSRPTTRTVASSFICHHRLSLQWKNRGLYDNVFSSHARL